MTARTEAAGVGITDVMVEAANRAYHDAWDYFDQRLKGQHQEFMRPAIEAAVGKRLLAADELREAASSASEYLDSRHGERFTTLDDALAAYDKAGGL